LRRSCPANKIKYGNFDRFFKKIRKIIKLKKKKKAKPQIMTSLGINLLRRI